MATTPQPGEFGVVRTATFVGQCIRLLTRSQVNHAFVCLDDGLIVEAQRVGARFAHVSKFAGRLVVYSRIHDTTETSFRVMQKATELVGTPYNFLDVAALALLSLGLRWDWLLNRAQTSRRLICSQLVDRAFRNAGLPLFDDDRPDGQVTPGDLLLLVAEDVPTHTPEALS